MFFFFPNIMAFRNQIQVTKKPEVEGGFGNIFSGNA